MSGPGPDSVADDKRREKDRIRAYLGIGGCIFGFAAIRFIGADLYFGYRMRFRMPDERMASHGELAFLYYGLIVGIPSVLLGTWGLSRAERAFPNCFRRLRALFAAFSPREQPKRAAAMGLALASLGIVATRLFIYHQRVVTNDEFYYQFDAKLFQSHRLYLTVSPLLGQFFPAFQGVFWNGRYFSKYFAGHSAVLAAGSKLGLGWWTVPILAVLAMIPFGLFVKRAFGDRAAATTLLMVAISPLYVLTGATSLSQPTVIFFYCWFLLCWLRYREGQESRARWKFAFLMGVAAAFMGLTRPVSAIGLLMPILVAEALARWRRREQGLAAELGIFAVAPVLGIAALLGVNGVQNGNAFRTAYSLHRFPLDRIMTFAHPDDWRRAIENVAITLGRLNWAAFGWPVSLVFVVWAFRSPLSRILGFSAIGFFLANHLTPSPGIDPVGPEHFAELAPLLALFTALGISRLLESEPGRSFDARWGVCVLVLFEVVVFLPQRLTNLERYVRQANRVKIMAERAGLHKAVIFANRVPYPWLSAPADHEGGRFFPWPLQAGEPDFNHDFLRQRAADRGAGFAEYGDDNLPVPDPDLRDDVLFLTDFGPADTIAMDLLPGRRSFALVLAAPGTLEVHLLSRVDGGVILDSRVVASTSAYDPNVFSP